MKTKALFLAAAMLCGNAASAPANIIEVVFTGIATGSYNKLTPCEIPGITSGVCGSLAGFQSAATETYTFDTDLGTLTQLPGGFQLDDAMSSAPFLKLDGVLLNGLGTFFAFPSNSLIVQNGVVQTPPYHGGYPFSRIYVALDYGIPGQLGGSTQFGGCPSSSGPCGSFIANSWTITGDLPFAVPGPIVGAGLPGLLAALGLLVWRKRDYQSTAPPPGWLPA